MSARAYRSRALARRKQAPVAFLGALTDTVPGDLGRRQEQRRPAVAVPLPTRNLSVGTPCPGSPIMHPPPHVSPSGWQLGSALPPASPLFHDCRLTWCAPAPPRPRSSRPRLATDAPIRSGADTSATSMSSTAHGTVPNSKRAMWDLLSTRLVRAAEYLDDHPDLERLDRLEFIVSYANPTSRALDSLRTTLGIELPVGRSAWSHDAPTLFDHGAFDAAAFAPAYAPKQTNELVDLGRALFFDPALSGDSRRACASCHRPELAFTDGLARRAALSGTHDAGRNTPTVINVGLQPGSFYDQRTAYLEDQITEVMGNAEEMGHSVDGAAVRLQRNRAYVTRFESAFGIAGDSALSAARLRMALAAYLRSLQAIDSRFDRATRGDTAPLSASERRGFTLFMGKARCGTCHFVPLFNGVTPPTFTESEPESLARRLGEPAHATRCTSIRTSDNSTWIGWSCTASRSRRRCFATSPSPHRTCTMACFGRSTR